MGRSIRRVEKWENGWERNDDRSVWGAKGGGLEGRKTGEVEGWKGIGLSI